MWETASEEQRKKNMLRPSEFMDLRQADAHLRTGHVLSVETNKPGQSNEILFIRPTYMS